MCDYSNLQVAKAFATKFLAHHCRPIWNQTSDCQQLLTNWLRNNGMSCDWSLRRLNMNGLFSPISMKAGRKVTNFSFKVIKSFFNWLFFFGLLRIFVFAFTVYHCYSVDHSEELKDKHIKTWKHFNILMACVNPTTPICTPDLNWKAAEMCWVFFMNFFPTKRDSSSKTNLCKLGGKRAGLQPFLTKQTFFGDKGFSWVQISGNPSDFFRGFSLLSLPSVLQNIWWSAQFNGSSRRQTDEWLCWKMWPFTSLLIAHPTAFRCHFYMCIFSLCSWLYSVTEFWKRHFVC